MTGVRSAEPRRALGLVSIIVRDYDEAIGFFCETLGFHLIEDSERPEESKRWVVVAPSRAGGARILLARAATPEQAEMVGRQAGGRVFLFLETDDFERDYELFRGRGVKFVRPPRSAEFGKVAVFEDLYRNLWDLIEPTRISRS